MDLHALEYFQPYSPELPNAHFHRVVALHDEPTLYWEEVIKLAPHFPRGWYELCHLPTADRVEFTRDYWCSKFTDYPTFVKFLIGFFGSVDEIGFYLTQPTFDAPFQAKCVYSISDDSGFFQANPPAPESSIKRMQNFYPKVQLPKDFLQFLTIHDGFSYLNDSGIIPSPSINPLSEQFQNSISQSELRTTSGIPVNPATLFPFYQSFNMSFFQCFWSDWYPDKEMGNVYYSGIDNLIFDSMSKGTGVETMAFESFLDWLTFYMEKID